MITECLQCKKHIRKELYWCIKCWQTLPHHIQEDVVMAYEPGQLKDGMVPPEFMAAMTEAMEYFEKRVKKS